MILKKRDTKCVYSKFEKAGEKAEEQMAFYLERQFDDNKNIVVLNDIRIENSQGMIAQIDHLVIHEFGFVIIESKSVTSAITINEEGEWIRHFNGKSQGMRSPIKQAEMQKDILKKILEENKEKLFRKHIVNKLLKASFEKFPFDIIVAISDTGIIKRPKNLDTSMVLKADAVCDHIQSIREGYRKKSKAILSLDIPSAFHHTTVLAIAEFLKSRHKPAKPIENTIKEPYKTYGHTSKNEESNQQTKSTFLCKKCDSDNLQIVWGKYGYYFKCQECDGNTPIKLVCKNKDCQVKLKKDKNEFYQVCETCNTKKLFYVNQ